MTTKQESLKLIKNSLYEIGYDENKITDNYPIITDNKVIYFDFVAFGHDKIQDTSTSCILVKYCEDENEEMQLVEDSVYSATPILITPKKDKVDVWKISVEKKSEVVWELKYDGLGEHFALNRVKLDYNKIVSSKEEVDQLTFFSANNLFKFAAKVNCELLGKEFKKAIYNAKKCININSEHEVKDLTSITMHIIAAKILNDKLILGRRYGNIHTIIDKLSKLYSDYFNSQYVYKYGEELIDSIYNSFRKDLSYRSIDNKILGNFYENTLFESDVAKNKELKQELGIYYTPHSIVNNMLEIMPIELIDFRSRYVLDGSCGSGSLLIGAYKRLKSLLPKRMSDELKHKYLTNMILGIDIDRFACEVARLELLLTSIPYGNGWKIYNEDFQIINNIQYKPSIIVANPPYKKIREGGEQIEKATIFLERYIDLLSEGGLLAIVLPESFLENINCKNARQKLLTNIDIYEIWSLPKGIFDTNNCATTVMIGRKVSEENLVDGPFKVRIVNKNKTSINKFKAKGCFDFNFVCRSQKQFLQNENYKIIFSPISSIIRKIEQNKKISEYINYTQGIQIPFKYNYPLVSDDYKEGYSKFFRNARYGFDKFKIEWQEQKETRYLKYNPDNIVNSNFKRRGLRLRENKREVLESHKVILLMNSTPGTFWRTKAAIDREGIYPSHSFWCMVPKNEQTSLEVIAALINSKLVNLYIGTNNRALNIKSDIILNIPMPDFTSEQKIEIKKLVQLIESSNDVSRNLEKMDKIIYSAFGLTNEEIYLVEQYYLNVSGSLEENLINIHDIEETVEVTGRTISVDLDNNFIEVQFVECEEVKYVDVTEEVPGWLLNENLSFTCIIKEEDFYERHICIKNVRPLDYTYLNETEFNNLLNNDLSYFYTNDDKKELKSFIGGDLNA
ncbi:hypothetical protein UT300018_31280 [Clostridium faecium]|uniref:site-specific DNA-methyltransferase (adenine-specific) n=1 Tax=Clostridium faecium TaxID=2762223 RepID=A0ABR8YNH5_9CLOT|nr:N-6 DNA methylase [Clostridium faecium]MBD8045741.1 N-6 DNA methylase [Clostridium faecium]